MRIGLINELRGRAGDGPTWDSISRRARLAEDLGFDVFVFEDALMYRSEDETQGVWESTTMAAALAAVTSKIDIAHSVVNSPYRSPAMMASIATTLDEISGGRYVLGIGAGNTPESDYHAFGFPTDHRYSRFAEAIEVIHTLLREGRFSFDGDFYKAKDAELVLRGPSSSGPEINIAAGGPKMMLQVARYADSWNWWAYDETIDQLVERFDPIFERLDEALDSEGRDPTTLQRTIDVYSMAPLGTAIAGRNPLMGSSQEIAEYVFRLGEIGFGEVRCDVLPQDLASLAAMAEVVQLVHAG